MSTFWQSSDNWQWSELFVQWISYAERCLHSSFIIIISELICIIYDDQYTVDNMCDKND